MLDEVVADVSSQLDAQAQLGVQIRRVDEVPELGPTNGGLWYQVPGVAAVFADLKGSTDLNANDGPQVAAYAYIYFVRAMAVIMDRFSAGYVDIQGDGIFGLFSGPASEFQAMACAITANIRVATLDIENGLSVDLSSRFHLDIQDESTLPIFGCNVYGRNARTSRCSERVSG